MADNRLTLMDQAFYAGHRAAGQREVMQVAWLYERPIDLERLQEFHRDLPLGMLGRRIQRSPLPFGRYRWVTDGRPTPIDIAQTPRPRDELAAWLDECAQQPIDPESGPAWRLSVVEFTDGSSAATVVMSHYIADGVGLIIGMSQTIMGAGTDCGYPPPRSGSRARALMRDAGETIRELPAVARAIAAGAREARRRKHDDTRVPPPRPAAAPAGAVESGADTADLDAPMVVPNLWVRIDLDLWNNRVEALGGTDNTLSVAVTAKLDQRMGRRHGPDSDGTGDVKVMLLVNDRTPGDLRALAVSFARLSIDPATLTTDLTDTRNAIKAGLKALQEEKDESSALLALTPFTPKRAWKQLVEYALNDPESPAVCSNLGDTGPALNRPDGELCDGTIGRGTSQHMTRRWLARMGGQLHVYCGVLHEHNQAWFHVRGYQPGSVHDRTELREVVDAVLADFGLSGRID